ncbi:Lactonase, 7-bladed beta-propeller-domain-containing protein [Lentinula aciculospora]|uniref:Lactonase, 7-bladed beta-propeller-domain-containing protein n=1 Tax=Lentinula aciculospora TaxID=153920 RepID=A0A9W9A5E4_9AGAR|nr:Lactonase, 7-bladed beta-propeller-domain-containing protein [Lentinula aciculospora]
MVNYTILAGGFAVPGFISTYVFNNETNSLSIAAQSFTGDNPSWIARHPQNPAVLYAVNEVQTIGNLQSFTVNNDTSVSLIDTITTQGVGPTFTNPLSTGEVSAMNFGSPNCSFISTDPNDPLHFLSTNSSGVAFPISQGEKSNPHMSLQYNDEVLVSDLGADKIWRLGRNDASSNSSFTVQGQIDRDVGSGPRRLAIRNDILFVVSETTSTLTAQRILVGPNSTTSPLLANISTYPADALPGSKFAAAELLISTPTDRFPNPLIYVSNRNIGSTIDPKGDTIAIFEFVNGTSLTVSTSNANINNTNEKRMKRIRKSSVLHDRDASSSSKSEGAGYSFNLLAQVPTGLQQIRSMALGQVDDGGDAYIIAGATTTGGVAILERVNGGRNLTLLANNQEVQNRTSFVFLSSL